MAALLDISFRAFRTYIGTMSDMVLRIASYNIRKARGLDQKRRPGRTLDVINGLDADIILLQEADKRLGQRPAALSRDLIERHSDFRVVEVAENEVSLGWHGNAVLVRSGIAALRVTRIDLPGTEPRGAVRVDFDHGPGLSVVGTHLGLLRRDRRAQLRAVCDAAQDADRVVIAGDFNEWSTARGLEPLDERFDTIAPGKSFHARRPVAALDRIALSAGIALHDAGVRDDRLSRRASDHLPVWSDVTVPQATATC